MSLVLPADQPDTVRKAAAMLKESGTVLMVPTETVYGLVCSWEDSAARQKIYAMKQRDAGKPFAAFVRTPDEAEKLAGIPLPQAARKLAARFMPGPITLIVPDAAGGTFGFRIPDHPLIQALLKESGMTLASTSANLSGNPPALQARGGDRDLALPPDLVVDGGVLPPDSAASTVVLTGADDSWKILRHGGVLEQDIAGTLE